MTTILVLITVLALSGTAYGNPTEPPQEPVTASNDISIHMNNITNTDSELPLDMSLVLICLLKMISPNIPCEMDVQTKWKVTPLDMMTAVNSRATCCAIWEITDCMVENAKLHCSADSERMFNRHMKNMTAHRNVKNCAAIPSGANDCALGPQTVDRVHRKHDYTMTPEQGAGNSSDQGDLFNDIDRSMLKHKSALGEVTNAISVRSIDVHDNGTKDTQAIAAVMSLLYNRTLLARELLERVERITVTHMVIDLHPTNHTKAPDVSKSRYYTTKRVFDSAMDKLFSKEP